VPTSDWTPTPDQVGSILRARTKDDNGTEVGTFTDDTRPNLVQVFDLIETAVQDVTVALKLTDEQPQVLWAQLRTIASIGAAMLVEMSFFPEQINTDRSPYEKLEEMYTKRIERLQAFITYRTEQERLDSCEDEEEEQEAQLALKPAYDFTMGEPDGTLTPLAGWRAAW